jgi:hypothetical protein
MTPEAVREQLYNRVVEKKSLRGSSEVISHINASIEKYADLNSRSKDYAYRSSMEHRSLIEWAAYYNVAYVVMMRMAGNPRVQQLQREIQFNIQTYMVGMKVFLLRESMTQYLKIFRARETAESLEPKRKAAKDVMAWFGMVDDPDGGSTKPLNVNIFNDSEQGLMRSVPGESMAISAKELEKELKELRQIEDMRERVAERNASQRQARRIGGGFSGDDVPEIEVD